MLINYHYKQSKNSPAKSRYRKEPDGNENRTWISVTFSSLLNTSILISLGREKRERECVIMYKQPA